jgi:hypothetical protein
MKLVLTRDLKNGKNFVRDGEVEYIQPPSSLVWASAPKISMPLALTTYVIQGVLSGLGRLFSL